MTEIAMPRRQATMEIFALESAYARLRSAWQEQGGLSIAQRRKFLKTLRGTLLQHADDYVAAISADFRGRSRHETLLTEIAVVVSAIDHAMPRIAQWSKASRIPLGWPIWPARAQTIPQACGVAGIVAPSNYPLQLALMPLISAISAGCRVLIKPSEMTPRTADLIARHVGDTFDADIVAVVCGDVEVAAAFVELPFDMLLFTGSPGIGAKVAVAAAKNMTPLILELGGKSPVIVDRSANLAVAAEAIVAGKLMNSGQTCVAPDYVLVPRENHEAMIGHLKQAAARLYPDAEARDYSAMLSDAAIGRLERLESGDRVEPLLRGAIAPPRFMPKLLVGVSPDHAAMQDEIFGPLLPLLPYDAIEDAIDLIRRQPSPLAIYWFGETNAGYDRMMSRTASGAVSINETVLHAGIAALPFGGVGGSGVGRYHGKAGFNAFSHERVVFRQARWSVTRLLRPPFGKMADRILAGLLKNPAERGRS